MHIDVQGGGRANFAVPLDSVTDWVDDGVPLWCWLVSAGCSGVSLGGDSHVMAKEALWEINIRTAGKGALIAMKNCV